MNQEKTRYILKVLNKVYKDGYRPSRFNEPYDVKLKNGLDAGCMINCLGHTFNLRNKQFDDYNIKPYKISNFLGETLPVPYFTEFLKYDNNQKNADIMIDFIKKTGLKVVKCAPNEIITDFKSWKIALYFSSNDFHYLLEDFSGAWSGKDGNFNIVEHFDGQTPPKEYNNEHTKSTYKLFDTFKITNPNANRNNKYVRDKDL